MGRARQKIYLPHITQSQQQEPSIGLCSRWVCFRSVLSEWCRPTISRGGSYLLLLRGIVRLYGCILFRNCPPGLLVSAIFVVYMVFSPKGSLLGSLGSYAATVPIRYDIRRTPGVIRRPATVTGPTAGRLQLIRLFLRLLGYISIVLLQSDGAGGRRAGRSETFFRTDDVSMLMFHGTFFSTAGTVKSSQVVGLRGYSQVKSSSGATRPRGDHPDTNLLLLSSLLRRLWRGLVEVRRP